MAGKEQQTTHRQQCLVEAGCVGLEERAENWRRMHAPDGCKELACRCQGETVLNRVTGLENEKDNFGCVEYSFHRGGGATV